MDNYREREADVFDACGTAWGIANDAINYCWAISIILKKFIDECDKCPHIKTIEDIHDTVSQIDQNGRNKKQKLRKSKDSDDRNALFELSDYNLATYDKLRNIYNSLLTLNDDPNNNDVLKSTLKKCLEFRPPQYLIDILLKNGDIDVYLETTPPPSFKR